MTTGPARTPKSTEAAFQSKEAMIRGILDVLSRTWTQAESPGSLQQMEEFFRHLDESTLRAISYQHGVFEPEIEPDDPAERGSGKLDG